MTIDEAISKYKEITNTDANCPAHCNISCDKCVQESNQIVKWLEELKELREYFNSTEIGKYRFQKGYNNAIDDAKDVILQSLCNERLIDTLHLRLEQLKAGKKDD